MTRCQALADMPEDQVRRGGVGRMIPPPLLAAIDQLRRMPLAISRLEATVDDTTHIHVSLVDHLIGAVVAVLSEFVPPEQLPAALDKLALQASAVPPRGAHGQSPLSYG
jgi:hypothetical protein